MESLSQIAISYDLNKILFIIAEETLFFVIFEMKSADIFYAKFGKKARVFDCQITDSDVRSVLSPTPRGGRRQTLAAGQIG